jgi:plastocyanin
MGVRRRLGILAVLAAALIVALAMAVAASAKTKHQPKRHATAHAARFWPDSEVTHVKLAFGPIAISPGQNNIRFDVARERPRVAGFITSFKPNLVYAHGSKCNGSVPRVDVIHLHHGVWIVNGAPTYAAGEEKTQFKSPEGFGYPYAPTDQWSLSYMIHNLTPQPTSVCLTYDLGFIPATSKFAKHIIGVRTQWMDVVGTIYPVFDVHQGSGTNGTFTYPDQDPTAPASFDNNWRVPQDETIVWMTGHLHPGGLYDSLWDTRIVNGKPKKVLLFNSRAHYFEPAGSVSWDVSMMTTPPNYRVKVKAGDVLSISASYDSSRASWYEAMGIMQVQMTSEDDGGVDPFKHNVAVAGVLNHGHLPENDNHGGGGPLVGPAASSLADGPLTDAGQVPIDNFVYGQGDLTNPGAKADPPTVHQGQSLTFVNDDFNVAPGEWHTITSCEAPCNGQTGIAYPLASAPPGRSFDSGELGLGGPPTANRTTWSTPTNLPAGTYNYFCRIHPFMRGTFRVIPAQ